MPASQTLVMACIALSDLYACVFTYIIIHSRRGVKHTTQLQGSAPPSIAPALAAPGSCCQYLGQYRDDPPGTWGLLDNEPGTVEQVIRVDRLLLRLDRRAVGRTASRETATCEVPSPPTHSAHADVGY